MNIINFDGISSFFCNTSENDESEYNGVFPFNFRSNIPNFRLFDWLRWDPHFSYGIYMKAVI